MTVMSEIIRRLLSFIIFSIYFFYYPSTLFPIFPSSRFLSTVSFSFLSWRHGSGHAGTACYRFCSSELAMTSNMHVALNTYITYLTHRVRFMNECSIFMNTI